MTALIAAAPHKITFTNGRQELSQGHDVESPTCLVHPTQTCDLFQQRTLCATEQLGEWMRGYSRSGRLPALLSPYLRKSGLIELEIGTPWRAYSGDKGSEFPGNNFEGRVGSGRGLTGRIRQLILPATEMTLSSELVGSRRIQLTFPMTLLHPQ